MKRYEIIDAIEEIQDNNSKRFVGVNEAELWTREGIADFVLKLLAEKDAEIERLKEEIDESDSHYVVFEKVEDGLVKHSGDLPSLKIAQRYTRSFGSNEFYIFKFIE